MRHRDRISFSLAAAALVVSVLGIGGVMRETQAVVAALVAGAVGMQLFARRRLDRVSPLLVFIGIAIGLTALQLLPLPESLREAINPVGEGLKQDGAEIAGTSPWSSLSNDPAHSLRGLVYLVTLFGVAAIALRFAASERGRFALMASVAATCGLAALVSGLHVLFAAESLYGVYEPSQATPRVVGPLLNGNHMGSLMAFGAVVSIGLAFYPRQNVRLRVFWIINTIGCVLIVLATLSRGAVLAFAFGLAVCGAALIAQRFDTTGPTMANGRRRRGGGGSALTSQLPIAIIIAFGLGIAIYSSAGKVASQLDNTSLTELSQPSSKYAAWKSSVQLAVESPWLGIGKGALEPTFTRVHDQSAYVTFSHLENEYLQAVVEWGIVGAIFLVLGFGWCMVRAFRRWREGPLAAAAIGAIAGVLLQSSVDFGLELLGLAVPMTIVAATLLAVPLREPAGAIVPTRIFRFGLVGALVLVGIAILGPAARSVQEDHEALLAGATLEEVHESIERHPLDYFGYGHAAGMMMRTGDPQAAKYLNHAMVLHPTHPGLHKLVARILVGKNRRGQAAVQYALALKGSNAPDKLLAEIIVLMPDVDDVAAALPTDPNRVELISHELTELKRPDIQLRWLARVIALPQRDTEITDRLYKLAMGRREWEFAEHAARVRLRVARTTTSRLMLARVHARRAEDSAQAVEWFANAGAGDTLFADVIRNGVRDDQNVLLAELSEVTGWRGVIEEKAEAWLLTCDVRTARREWDKAVECLHRLSGAGAAVTPKTRGEVNERLTKVKEQRTLESRQQALEAVKRELAADKKK